LQSLYLKEHSRVDLPPCQILVGSKQVLVGSQKDAGLSTLQAKVYIALLRLGTTQVGELCSVSEVARPEVYRILHELIDKDLVNRNLTSPTTYTAVEPERVKSLLIGKVKQTLESVEGKRQTWLVHSNR